MFKKGPDIDKKKLLLKASDVKKDSLTRLRHLKTLIEHLEHNELPPLFKEHFNFIYNTFIDSFSTFDYNSEQRRDDLDCILFMLEKILIFNPELIKKRWQFYTSFSDLLQIFVLNSANMFVTKVHNQAMLDEQVRMCKRIMNIYRCMVMKIYMNSSTWEQLLNVMLSITEQLFPIIPPEKKEVTIGGRIAPAFFQTFIVSWIRANLYVHISDQMWHKFHRVMKSLVKWRELVEEWSTTMGSLTRVLVKHVYGLNLTDLPLDKPQDRRQRPRPLKSLSTAEPSNRNRAVDYHNPSSLGTNPNPQGSSRLNTQSYLKDTSMRGLMRSSSDGALYVNQAKLHRNSREPTMSLQFNVLRRIRSEDILLETNLGMFYNVRSNSPSHNDVMDATSLKDSNMIIENDHNITSKPLDHSNIGSKKQDQTSDNSDKCVLLGGTIRGWTSENSVIMWRRMLGLFGNINEIEDPDIHLVAVRCLAVILRDFIKTRENQGISLDNQSSPSLPSLIPPYTHSFAWVLETTCLPEQYKESRLTAYKLLCLMIIRRHDIELSQQYYAAFYEALNRGLHSEDPAIYSSVIKNSTQIISLEIPGSTFLIHSLLDRSRKILLGDVKQMLIATTPRDQSVQILSSILAIYRFMKKLTVVRPDPSYFMNISSSGDMRSKIFDTLLQSYTSPTILDANIRSKTLCAMVLHLYQELSDKCDTPDTERLFSALLIDLQEFTEASTFRINCDLLRLFVDHAAFLVLTRPSLVSTIIQTICQVILRLSTLDSSKESIHCLLVCLEEWCIAVGKNNLLKPVFHLKADDDEDDASCKNLNESLVTIVLRSLVSVINDQQYADDSSQKTKKSSSKGSDNHSNSHKSLSGQLDYRDRTITNDNQKPVNDKLRNNENLKAIKLACKVSHNKLLTYLGHFPFKQLGPASLSCCVNELDYLGNDSETISSTSPSNCLFLVVNGTTIISMIGARRQANGLYGPIHLLVRNLCGKYSWDVSSMDLECFNQTNELDNDSLSLDPETFQVEETPRISMKYDSEDGNSSSSMSSRSSTNRDCISGLMNHLTLSLINSGSLNSSTQSSYKKRNSAQSISNPRLKVAAAEETMIALLTNQRFQELNFCERSNDLDRVVVKFNTESNPKAEIDYRPDNRSQPELTFEQCRRLAQQLGLFSWEKRTHVDTLAKSPRLLRELKNLDTQLGRETHKIAVIYVANGQEDKNSILSNSSGSRAFEDFVAGLGWEVNLATHLGFMGGLQTNKSTGETSPYYCNSITEIMFHVSTRIPINAAADDESLNRKLRHLGNDEIHIVWSEHSREYRRGIIPTEFGDVIIAIYPMLTFQGYYRIQILCKQNVPPFGPLFDNSIVHQSCLAPLVRATAVNASRAKRLKLPYYQSHYEERNRLIETIVQNHKERQSFEEFTCQFYKTGIPLNMSSPRDRSNRTGNPSADASCYN